MEIQDNADLWSIGMLAHASGLTVKTIRFYSDAGLLSAARTTAGHRRYAPADLTRLQAIRSLRSLGVDLPTIAAVLTNAGDLQHVLRTHVLALQARLRAVQRQLAVARAAAEAPPERTVDRLHALTRIEAAERDQLLHWFWDRALTEVAADDAAWFRSAGVPELPAEPTGEQLDAWLEVADLALDPDFQRASQASASWFADHARRDLDAVTWQQDLARALDFARQARTDGLDPGDPRSQHAVQTYVTAYATAFDQVPSPAFHFWLAQQLHDLKDPRAERWWQLITRIQQTPDSPRHVADIAWLHRALADTADQRNNRNTSNPPAGECANPPQ